MTTKHLGQITEGVVEGWATRYEKRDDDFYCWECGSQIRQTTCFVSMHLKAFDPSCAGSGKVLKINYPYCPKCDGDLSHVTACYHYIGIPIRI